MLSIWKVALGCPNRPGAGSPLSPGEEWIIEKQRGVYQEVIKPERLVFTYAFEDDAARLLHQTIVAISFGDEGGGRTRVILRQSIFESVSARDDHVRGWTQAIERLTKYLVSIN